MTTTDTGALPHPVSPAAVVVPESLREVAQFPADAPTDVQAQVWVRVLALAARELAGCTRGADTWSAPAQSEVVDTLDEVARLTVVAKAPVLAAQEARGAWRTPGVRDFADYRAKTTRAGKGAARREVDAGRTVHALDGGLDALADGTLTPAHVDKLATIAGKLPEDRKDALLTGAGAQKIKDLAHKHDAGRFAGKVEDLAAAMSAQDVQDAHDTARARRHLQLTPTGDGTTRISGQVDDLAAHTIRLALEAATPRPGVEDTRTGGQRHADALVALAETALTGAKATGNARSQILITMSEHTFTHTRRHLQAARQAGPDGDAAGTCETAQDLGPAPVVRYQDGPLLPLSEIGRALCDSDVARLVIGADSHPLDLGRSVRLFTAAQRRAIIARDTACAWPECTMPTRYSEVHHLDWYDDDHGHTDTHRGVLVCSFHHHELHRRNLDLVRDTGLRRAAGPPRATGQGIPLPGDPGYEPPKYTLVPRSHTRAGREEATRARLLTEVRADSTARKARRAS